MRQYRASFSTLIAEWPLKDQGAAAGGMCGLALHQHPSRPPGIRFAAAVGLAALRTEPQALADGPPDPSPVRPRLPTSASAVTAVGCFGARLIDSPGYPQLTTTDDRVIRPTVVVRVWESCR